MPAQTSPARRLRRWTAGAALIVFPALLVPQALIDPTGTGTGADMVRAASESRGTLIASALLLMVSALLMIPAVTAVLHQARDRGAAVGNVGATLAVLGGLGHFAIAMFYLISLPLDGGDPALMVAYVDRLNETAAIGAVVFPLILCFGLGVAVLPWAAWRAGAVPVWVPALATTAAVTHFLLPEGIAFAAEVQLTALTVAYAVLGLRVLRMTDGEWDGARSAPHGEVAVPA